jgi:L-ascorbate metabolism protein UlaG (beta-lactamase superfamily)
MFHRPNRKKSVQFLSAGVIILAMTITDNLHWLGHSAFRWEGSKVVYFDPYKLSAYARKADIILVSHEHFDHCSPGDIAKITTKDTVIIASADAAGQLRAAKVLCKELKSLSPGDAIAVSGVAIKAVPGYNTNKSFHPRASGKLGFVVTMDGVSVYHAGDTDLIPEMKSVQCDIALLPVSGTYVMTVGEAAEAAIVIKPKVAIPMHYGEVAGSPRDGKMFSDALAGKVDVRVLTKED